MVTGSPVPFNPSGEVGLGQGMLEVIDVHTYYGESHILHGVSLIVKAGAVACLLGRNGAGKTTLINSIIGFTPPRQGRVMFKGRDITGLPEYRIAREGIGLVPQGRRIFKRLTVLENLQVACKGTEDLNRNLQTIYSYFPVLLERSKSKGGQLSGGEQQMLAIARALLLNPALLLLDEPSEGLAPMIVENIGNIIKRLAETGLSILLVEQNLSQAFDLADYIYIIGNGRIVHESSPQLIKDNDQLKAQYLGV